MTRALPALLLLLALFTLAGAGPDEAKEPPLRFVLSVEGGEDIPVRLDEPFRVGDARCVLRLDAHRVFALAAFRFHFPRDFAFEADLTDPDACQWSFDGPNSQVLIVRTNADAVPADMVWEFANAISETFQDAKRTPAKLTLGGRELTGLRITGSVVGQRAVQEVYGFTAGDATYLLALQDLPDDQDAASPDGRKALEMLKRSFRFEARGG